ncbi:phosphatidylethanolamine-binding protein [Mytilinidion resinicola]|uniref:Phosphatidylethanolamine-binding protein n=1 Tax=Mytilinidion resinicola TaxID=574789 RepID=A0A6A6YG98_9PEZI|nr:phosphatidylethanolamine-binding protein [Mytilinidion resinicola]KAF2806917.1 phosphatidylethanolamine-binding protein [Mytilinidion resinicola]
MLRYLSFGLLFVQLLQLSTFSHALPTDQQPLKEEIDGSLSSVRDALKEAEIIPTVIDDFSPILTLDVSWPKKDAELGNTLKVKHVQDEPTITLKSGNGSTLLDVLNLGGKKNTTYVVALTDPDAPSRDNPEWSEICHWIVAVTANKTETIMPYKAPGPPPKTGKHRYVFLVFAPKNGTTEPLNLTKPSDRKHWGSGIQGFGAAWWSELNGLITIGANFIYAQNKKQ